MLTRSHIIYVHKILNCDWVSTRNLSSNLNQLVESYLCDEHPNNLFISDELDICNIHLKDFEECSSSLEILSNHKPQIKFYDHAPEFIDSKDMWTGNTGLHLAVKYSHFNIALYLLEQGAKVVMPEIS